MPKEEIVIYGAETITGQMTFRWRPDENIKRPDDLDKSEDNKHN